MFDALREALVAGLRLGLAPNPLFGTIGAMIAAGLAGHRRPSRGQEIAAGIVVLAAWIVGDGLRVLSRAEDALAGVGAFAEGWPGWLMLALWLALSLTVGYLVPAAAGIIVGRRVTHGTGWLAATAVAGSTAVALSVLTLRLV